MAILYPRIELPLTIATSEYASGDVVGGLQTLSSVALARGVILNKVLLVDADNESAAFTLWLFNAAPTAIADGAAFAPTAADLQKVVAKVSIAAADYVSINSMAVAVISDINDVIPSNIGVLYAYLVIADTTTYSADDDLWLALDFLPEGRDR